MGKEKNIEIFAYPDINVQLVFLPFSRFAASTAPRVALSVTRQYTTEVLDAAMKALPLDNILKLTALDHTRLDEQFWHTHAPRWRLLECIQLTPLAARGLREMILQDNGGRENPLLPSLTNLAIYKSTLTSTRIRRLRDALMKRVNQGVPLETLDLSSCYALISAGYGVELLCQIVVQVWAPYAYSGPFIAYSEDDSGAEDYSDSDDESEPRSSGDEEGGDEDIDEEEEEGD